MALGQGARRGSDAAARDGACSGTPCSVCSGSSATSPASPLGITNCAMLMTMVPSRQERGCAGSNG
jgi:hypothetical protein